MRRILALLFAATVALPVAADPVPERRMSWSEGTDLAGHDLGQIFDTTLEACEATCLADAACEAATFNARNGACFPKSAITGTSPYSGAISGFVRRTPAPILASAASRAADLAFLGADDLARAERLARRMGRDFVTNSADPEAIAAEQAQSEGARARDLQGALVAIGDGAAQWLDFARLRLPESSDDAMLAAVNAYLRAPDAATQADVLAFLAEALEGSGRGRDMIAALRKAAAVSRRADIVEALAAAEAKYGFRITGNEAEADGALPRFCAYFSENLARSGVDYASFVQLPARGLSVEPEGSQLCIGGLERGERYQITFRKGLPSASGETLSKDVTLSAYLRDRAPQVSFPGRAYILPRGADNGLPVETVNTGSVALSLLRISDRNLVEAMRADYFARPLDAWDAGNLSEKLAEEVWSGTADVAMEINREMTTRLPVQEVTGPLGPGVYALKATVPGTDAYDAPVAIQWFVISDLGMSTFSGTDGLTIAVRRLSDAAAVTGAEVQLVSRANTVIATAAADAEGIVHFDAALSAGRDNAAPALVAVRTGDDMSFLSLTDPEFDLSDRGVAGLPPAPPIDVFLSTDRGAYRAGETVYATMLTRDTTTAALAQVPLTVVLARPDGVEYARQVVADAGAGGHVAALPIAATAPRGTWRLDVFADPKAPALASARLLVEDFLPERIDFDLSLPEGMLAIDDVPDLGVSARYLFGAPGAGLEYEGDVRLAAAQALPGYEGYAFGRHDAPFDPYFESIGAGATDDTGAAEIAAALPAAARKADRPLEATFIIRLREGSGRPVERRISRPVMPGAPVIGIAPLFDGAVAEGEKARFRVVALGPDAAPTPVPVHWRVNRLETSYQWYSVNGSWNWEPLTRRTRIAEGDIRLDGPTEIAAPTEWGEYELVVEGGGAEASSLFSAGWYAPAGAVESPDKLALSLDRPAYRAGDTARVRIVAPADGVALVSVMSNRLVALKSVTVTAGENRVELPVTEEWGAGVYVAASVVRPLAARAGRAPVRALGLSPAAVDPGARRLSARFEMPETSAPRAPLPVALRVEGVAPGETAYATIAAVDAGILNLTAFKSPDPLGHYFGQRRLGVGLRDLYGRLIDGRAGTPGALRSGGDAGGLTSQAPPPTEELVAFFSGPVTVGADGLAHANFDMPAFNGTVKLMAVVWSKTGVGQADAEVLVRDPVVVTASVPRFMAPGDRSRLLLEIVHAEGPAGRMPLALSAQGLVFGPVPTEITLAEHGKQVLDLPFVAPAEGIREIQVSLTTPDGKQLEKTLTLPVEINDPAVSRQSRFDLASGQTFTFDANVFAGFRTGSARAVIAAGPLARLDAPGLLAALDAYPYGCTEQITSKAMPLLYLSSVASAMGLGAPDDLGARIDGAIEKVLINQDSSGAFGLWRAESGDGWLDAYVTDFLSRARKAGHAVPDVAFRNALDNLRNQVNYAPDFDRHSNGGGALLAYQLMVLAREGQAAVGDLRYYVDVKGGDFASPLAAAQLGAALASYGDQARADAMFDRAVGLMSDTPQAAVWRDDYGSDLRDMAAVAALAREAGSTAVDGDALAARLADRVGGVRLSTQEATWMLLAAHALVDRPDAGGLTIDGAAPDGPLIGMIDAETAGKSIAIANPGTRTQTLTLTTTGVPETPEPAGGKGWRINRTVYTMDGAPVDPAEIAQGTRLVTVLEIVPLGAQEARLMIDDPLPAGFEIDNPNLIRGGDIAALDWLDITTDTRMTEFRQDRFRAAVDWRGDEPFRLAYIARAVSPGSFHHPAASVEDMYRPEMRAHTDTGRVEVK